MSDFATRLRELRLGRGLRQKDLATALGLAQTTIANYEQKQRFPDEPTLVRIADFFGVSLDALMGRSNGTGVTGTGVTGAGTADGGAAGSGLSGAGSVGAGQGGRTVPPGGAGSSLSLPQSGLAREYFFLLRERGREKALARLRDAMGEGASIAQIYLDVLAPALREVGRLWALGEMSVAEEHEFSESTQRLMSFFLPPAPPPVRPTLRCVVMPVSGEPHLIGARMVADCLSMAGIEARFTGGDLSIRHMREMLLASPPDLVALSVTLPQNLNAAADAVESLRAIRELSGTRIMVGGQAFHAQPDLWTRLGADGTAVDAAVAVQTALRLLRGKD
jgi:methanogenic corrinoid protein MtbC1/DNA-binding XRE family transcriptional regulator